MIWKFITFFVRKLDPEIAHKLTIKSLKLGLHPRLNQSVIPIKIGNLIFKNPANLLNDCGIKSPFTRNYKLEPKDGDLLVWPSWVPHEVDINNSDKQRINIAINVSFIGVDNA